MDFATDFMHAPTSIASVNKDHAYDRLGLVPGASRADITRAYRQLARRLHPDVAADPAAAERFAALTQAYRELLAATARDAPGSPIPVRRMRAAGPPPLVAGPVHVMPAPRRRRGGDDG